MKREGMGWALLAIILFCLAACNDNTGPSTGTSTHFVTTYDSVAVDSIHVDTPK